MTAPSSYVDRVRALVGRGLSRELGAELLEAGDPPALAHLEAAVDADLRLMSVFDAVRRGPAEALAGLCEADVERACNGPLLWRGDQA